MFSNKKFFFTIWYYYYILNNDSMLFCLAFFIITPKKGTLHVEIVIYLLFATPPHKTETGTPNGWGTTNSKPPGPIIMMSQSETLSSN